MRAMTWPFFTTELKSTYSSLIFPDTWEPTRTVMTALSAPVAEMAATMVPLVTGTVRNEERLPRLWL